MILLPRILPADASPLFEAILDSISLTVLMTPLLWWLLLRPLQQAALQRDRFLKDLFSTIEEERKRIANELHDGVGQSLSLLISGLRSLSDRRDSESSPRRAEEMRQIAQRTLMDVKQMALGLRPSILDDLGLIFAIERVAEELRSVHQIEVIVDVQSLGTQRLNSAIETALFRMVQEALSNVIKYSEATMIEIHLRYVTGEITLEIVDNGRGIDPQILNQPGHLSGHLGLVGMAERAALLGGKLVIESAPGTGTRILVRIPLS